MLTGDPYADALAKAASIVKAAVAALHAPAPTTTTTMPTTAAPASGGVSLPVLLLGGVALFLIVKGSRK